MQNQRITITIEHSDKNIPFKSFMSIAYNTVSLLRGVDRESSPEHDLSIQWYISQVSMSSPLSLTLEEAPIIKEREIIHREIIKPFINDINRLERGEKPKVFTPDMERRAQSLVRVLSVDGISSIKFESDGAKAQPTQHLAAYVDSDLKQYAPYYEVGSIEGHLEIISVKGRDTVQIQDLRYGIEVTCNVSTIQLEEAKELLRKRVVIRGRVKYNRKRPQVVVDVFDIRELKDSKHAPQPEDIGRLDLTGDIDPVDYLRGDYCNKTS